MFIDIDLTKTPQRPKLYLCKPNKTIIASLKEHYNSSLKLNLTTLNELTFDLPYMIDINHQFQRNINCDLIKNRYLIKLILGEYTEFFIINNPSSNADDNSDFYQINCYSLEYELKDKNIRSYKIDSVKLSEIMSVTGFDRSVTTITDGISTTVVTHTDGILKETAWTLGSYPETLNSVYRSFDVSVKTKLDFILEIAEKFNLVAKFDSVNRKINFYTIDDIGIYKGLIISDKRYLRTIVQNIDSETFCTRLKVYGKDGLTINSINPTGQSPIEDYSYFLFPFERDEITRTVFKHSDYMSDDLCHKLLDYQILLSQNRDGFSTLLSQLTTYQSNLTTKQNEMTLLTDAMKIIDDNIESAKNTGHSTTTLIAEKVAQQLLIDAKQLEIDGINSQITGVKSSITEIQTTLSYEGYFSSTPELLLELQTSYQIDKDWTNDSLLSSTDLYIYGLDEMEKRKNPTVIIQMNIVNFLEILSEQSNWDKINIGDSISIKHEQLGIDLTARIIECNFDFESAEIQLTISNVKSKNSKLEDILYNTTSVVDIVDVNRLRWDSSLINATEYVDQQIQEMTGTLLNLNIDINRFAADGYITLTESQALELTLEQAISESQDILTIAYNLDISTERIAYSNALDALETELRSKWIDQPSYNPPIVVLDTERVIITNLFKDVENKKSILINLIGLTRQNDGKRYVEDQVTELNTVLSELQLQVNEFIDNDKITELEATDILSPLVAQVTLESNDIVAIAVQLDDIVDHTEKTIDVSKYDYQILESAKNNYQTAFSALIGEIDDWLNQLSSDYPIEISVSKGKTVNKKFKNVENAKNLLESTIATIQSNNELTYVDQQVFEANVAITAMQTDITSFAKDNYITYDEYISLKGSFDNIVAESADIIDIAQSMSVSTTLINNYQNSLTGTIASCGVDGLQVELEKWIILLPTSPDKKITKKQKDTLLNKFKLVMSTKLKLNNAITLATPEYSVDGEISIRGTGANHNSDRLLRINRKKKTASSADGRGLMLTVISREDLSIIFTQLYDTYNSDEVGRNLLATKLDSLDDTVIVTLTSYNSIGWNSTLLTAMIKCGGTGTDTGAGKFPFAFIGIPGLFKGSALEVFSDSGIKAPYADIFTKVIDGTPQGIAVGTSVISAQAILAVQTAESDKVVAMVDINKVALNTTITSSEKKTVKKYWDAIVAEKTDIDSQANYWNTIDYPDVQSALINYDSNYSTFYAYITPILSDMTSSSTIVSATFIANFTNYYNFKIALLKAIMGVARNYIGDAISGLAESMISLGAEINDAFSDSKIYEPEASRLASDLASVKSESEPLILLATNLGLDKTGDYEKFNYQKALDDLTTLLGTWIGKDSSDYPIDVTADEKTAVSTGFSTVQTTKSFLLNKISNVQVDNANLVIVNSLKTFVDTIYTADPTNFSSQTDGLIECWFYGYAPLLTNLPSSDWTTNTIKVKHLGDLFYDIVSGNAYRFSYTTAYEWTPITDTTVIATLLEDSRSQGSLDTKRRIFITQPIPPYSIEDLWRQINGDIKICIVEKPTGSYVTTDWIDSTDYTDNIVAKMTKSIANQAKTDATSALDDLSDIANDNKIKKDEKVRTLKPRWDIIVSEKANIDAQVLLYPSGAMTALYGTYVSNHGILNAYLNVTVLSGNSTAILADLTTFSMIDRDLFNLNFNNYYNAREALLNFIASAAKAYAESRTPILGFLDNDSVTIATDSAGNGGVYTNAVSRIYIYIGGTDDSVNWSVTTSPSSGVSGSLSGKTYTVSNMTVDNGFVDFTATKSGNANVVKRFSISKAKSGTIGQNATSYWLVTSVPAIGKSISGVYTPTSFTITGKSQTGTGSPANYSGRFVIDDSMDGVNYTNRYTSASDESIKSYTPLAGIKTLKVSMYLAGGTSSLLDQQIIPIVSDGSNGSNGTNGTNGTNGSYVSNIFIRSSSNPPATPTGTTGAIPSGWYDVPPTGTTPPLWFSKGTVLNNVLTIPWSDPVRLDGAIGATGDSIIAEYSIDGSTLWHSTFTSGDKYMHTKIGINGTFGTAIKIVGDNGVDGSIVTEAYIPLFYPAHSSYVSTTDVTNFKLLTMGSTALTTFVSGFAISSANILHNIGVWPVGTTFALEAIWYSTNSSYHAEVELFNGVGSGFPSSYMNTALTSPKKIRSGTFSIANGTTIAVGISCDGGACRICRADLVVFPPV